MARVRLFREAPTETTFASAGLALGVGGRPLLGLSECVRARPPAALRRINDGSPSTFRVTATRRSRYVTFRVTATANAPGRRVQIVHSTAGTDSA